MTIPLTPLIALRTAEPDEGLHEAYGDPNVSDDEFEARAYALYPYVEGDDEEA